MNKILKVILIVLLLGIMVTALVFAIKGVGDSNNSNSGTTSDYTDKDLQNAYDQGYKDANGDKSELESIRVQNSALMQESADLTVANNSMKAQITSLTQERDGLIQQRDFLQTQSEQNAAEIKMLNAQILNLNNQIADLNNQLITNSNSVAALNSRIAELQKTIAFYEQFVVQFETDDQALVTFEFAGSVYDGKVVNKGDRVTTTTPASTEYVIFNYWMVDGERIDLETYIVTSNVRIVADVTYKYIVNFNVENTIKYTQIVENGQFAEEPTKPKKNGYTFKYWTLDGEHQVDVEQYAIIANTTFIAKFVELYTVTFEVDGEVKASRRIEKGATTTPLSPEVPDNMEFVGWTLNGNIVDVAHYKIEEDTNFVALFRDITQYTVRFKSYTLQDLGGGMQGWTWNYIATQLVTNGNIPSPVYPSYPSQCVFKGWSVNGELVDLSTYTITQDTVFESVLQYPNQTYTVTYMSYDGKTTLGTETVKWGESPKGVDVDHNMAIGSYLCTFQGWHTSKVSTTGNYYGEGTSVSNIAVTSNLTLYAVYRQLIIA